LLLVLVAIGVVSGIALTILISDSVALKSRQSAEKAELAQLAAEASDRLRELTQIAQGRVDEVYASPVIADLPEGQRRVISSWLTGESQAPPTAAIANIPAELSMRNAVEFQAAIDYLRNRLSLLLAETESVVRVEAAEIISVSDGALGLYYDAPTLEHLRDLLAVLSQTQAYTSAQTPLLSDEAAALRTDVASIVTVQRWSILAVSALGGLAVFLLCYYLAKVTSGILNEAVVERTEMEELTRDLEHRNQQLSALYNVFNEITDTLSLRYVVRATIYESLKIMHADLTVLRILRGEDLEVAGAMTSSEKEIEGLPPVKLGDGPTGRAAKRGRSLRIDEGGERMMAPPNVAPDAEGAPSNQGQLGALLESGIIVPLIVGARVVGTISCWSCQPFAFNDNDERILEMMGSQVATAIVAADTTERSERRAHQDPLTSLPNRRQLDEDIAGPLQRMSQGVVAMLDIDHFKRFNDEYGHRVGDVTLQKVAAVLRSSVRDEDFVYRYGGEEFVVVFSDTNAYEATMLANRLRLAVEAAPISGENLEPVGPVTISIGLAAMPAHGSDVENLIELADKAMYRAKESGRNRVCIWDVNDANSSLEAIA
jgi:diguanylate cyclase (GGDEF)-like protein